MKPRIKYRKGKWHAVDGLYFGSGLNPLHAFTQMQRKRDAACQERIALWDYCLSVGKRPSLWQRIKGAFKK